MNPLPIDADLAWENDRVIDMAQAMLGLITPNMQAIAFEAHYEETSVDLYFALTAMTRVDRQMIEFIAEDLSVLEDVGIRIHLWVGDDWAHDWPGCPYRRVFAVAPDRGSMGSSATNSGLPWKDYRMATDLTIELADSAGELARVGLALGTAGVNIEGLCAVTHGGPTAELHVVVDDAEAAFGALDAAGIAVKADTEVLVVEVDDRPGMLGEIGQWLGGEGVNVELIYLATATRLVIGADDLRRAQLVLERELDLN